MALHAWYSREARDLPWRRTSDPYAIWVAETMLQQTQVATVIPYYARWLDRFPDLPTLAAADEGEVLRLWQGLGYYRRAQNLWRAARRVVDDHGATVPRVPASFRSLPGVGPYTVAAVLSIAFDVPLAAVDGNVKRVLSRFAALEAPITSPLATREIERLAQGLMRGRPGRHNQAMMELGATLCQPRAPRCSSCPLGSSCLALKTGVPAAYPRRVKRRPVPHEHLAVALVRSRGRILLYRRPYGGLLAGLWDLPSWALDSLGAEPVLSLSARLGERFGVVVQPEAATRLAEIKHAYTHLKVTLHPFELISSEEPLSADRAADGVGCRWVSPSELARHALPKAALKVLEAAARFAQEGSAQPPALV